MSRLKVIAGKQHTPSDILSDKERAIGLLSLESEVCDLKRMSDLVLLAADEDDGGSGSLLDFAAYELSQKIEKFKERYYRALRGEELGA